MRFVVRTILIAVFASLSFFGFADTQIWTGAGTTTNASDPANWDTNTAPSANDILKFGAGPTNKVCNWDLADNITLGQLFFEDGGYTVSVATPLHVKLINGPAVRATHATGVNIFAPILTLDSFTGLEVTNAGAELQLPNGIDGAGRIAKQGEGNLALGGVGSWQTISSLQVSGGLKLLSNTAVPAGCSISMQNNNSKLDLNGQDGTFAGLNGSGSVLFSNGTLNLNIAAAGFFVFTGSFSGTGNAVILGQGKQDLNPTSAFTGEISVEESASCTISGICTGTDVTCNDQSKLICIGTIDELEMNDQSVCQASFNTQCTSAVFNSGTELECGIVGTGLNTKLVCTGPCTLNNAVLDCQIGAGNIGDEFDIIVCGGMNGQFVNIADGQTIQFGVEYLLGDYTNSGFTVTLSGAPCTPSTISLSGNLSPIVGVAASYSVQISDAQGIGTLALFIDGVPDTSAPDQQSGVTVDFTQNFTTPGEHILKMVFTPDNPAYCACETTLTVNVTQPPCIAPSFEATQPAQVVCGETAQVPVTLTGGEEAPTGTFTVMIDGTAAGLPVDVSNTNLNFTSSQPGAHTLTVHYSGDETYCPADTAPMTINVVKRTAGILLMYNRPPLFGGLELSAIVSVDGGSAQGKTVTFRIDGNITGTVVVPPGGNVQNFPNQQETLARGLHIATATIEAENCDEGATASIEFHVGDVGDNDGDGYLNEEEIAAGININDYADTPGPSDQPLSDPQTGAAVKAGTIKVNAKKPNSDSITITGTFPLPSDQLPESIIVNIGDHAVAFSQQKKGTYTNGTESFKLKSKNGFAAFTYKVAKKSVGTDLADEGLTTDKDAKKERHEIKIRIIFNGILFEIDQPIDWTSKKNVSGSGTAPKVK